MISFILFSSFKINSEIEDENWLLFKQVYSLVKESYVEDKKSDEIISGALKGLAKATGPESGYLSKENYLHYQEVQKMEYQLPFYITKDDGFAKIISTFDGKGLEIEEGDILKNVEGKAIFDFSYPETLMEIKSDKEVELNCSFMKKGTFKVFEKKIKTAKYAEPSVLKINEKTCVFQLPCLEHKIGEDLKEKLNPYSKIILDLRFCASDDIESALIWAGYLFGKGELKVSSKGGLKKISYDGEGIFLKKHCFILVDSTTARGGEVLTLAGAQTFKIAGMNTFGFASKHQTLTLKNGDKMIVLEGYFLNKEGEELKDKSITPDIIIENLSKERNIEIYSEFANKLK